MLTDAVVEVLEGSTIVGVVEVVDMVAVKLTLATDAALREATDAILWVEIA